MMNGIGGFQPAFYLLKEVHNFKNLLVGNLYLPVKNISIFISL